MLCEKTARGGAWRREGAEGCGRSLVLLLQCLRFLKWVFANLMGSRFLSRDFCDLRVNVHVVTNPRINMINDFTFYFFIF